MNNPGAHEPRQLIGLMLVKNDDRYVEQALRNILDFCDRVIVLDNESQDRTSEILAGVAAQANGKIVVHRINNIAESHDFVVPFLGSRSWMLAVDGDEIYDPKGLVLLRHRIVSGEFDSYWRLYGHVLNVIKWNRKLNLAKGYASPPGHPMTKLYNLEAIQSWTDADQRLHGGSMVLKASWENKEGIYAFFHHMPWEESPFRCLHMVFVKRSSRQRWTTSKWSPADVLHRQQLGVTGWIRLKSLIYDAWIVVRHKTGKDMAYRRGPLIVRDTEPFFVFR